MSDHILSLSTSIEPAETFEVEDGGEMKTFELLGFEHLSPEQEAKATAAFTRFQQCAVRLDRAQSDAAAEKLAGELRKRRIDVLCLLTTMPREVAEKLPMSAQVQLFKAVREESGQDDDGGDVS